MIKEEIQSRIEKAMETVDPTEVKIHLEDDGVLYVLVLSWQFQDHGLLDRVTQCMGYIDEHASDIYEDFEIKVEPVTPEEFQERLVPWPE